MKALGHNDYFSSCIKYSAHQDIIHIYWYPPLAFPLAYTQRPEGRHSLNCQKPLLILHACNPHMHQHVRVDKLGTLAPCLDITF